jgi:transketolase
VRQQLIQWTSRRYGRRRPTRRRKARIVRIQGEEKKKKYSKGLEDFQRAEGRVSRIGKRVAKALSKGASTYEQERKKSAGKKKDGSIRDFAPNVGEAVSASLREVSSVPADLADAVNTKGSRRLLRNQIRMASDMLRIPR